MKALGLKGRPDHCKLDPDREVLNRRAPQIETHHKPQIRGARNSTWNHRKGHPKNHNILEEVNVGKYLNGQAKEIERISCEAPPQRSTMQLQQRVRKISMN